MILIMNKTTTMMMIIMVIRFMVSHPRYDQRNVSNLPSYAPPNWILYVFGGYWCVGGFVVSQLAAIAINKIIDWASFVVLSVAFRSYHFR